MKEKLRKPIFALYHAYYVQYAYICFQIFKKNFEVALNFVFVSIASN